MNPKLKKMIEERKKLHNDACAEVQRTGDEFLGLPQDTADEDRGAAFKTFKKAEYTAERTKAALDEAENIGRARQSFTPVAADDPNNLGMDEKEVREYSLLRAINAQLNKDWSGAELEKEASDEIGKRTKREARGFWVPSEVQRRDLNVGTPSAGGYTVQTTVMAQNFIDILRKKMVVKQLGAQVWSGLIGHLSVPKQTGAAQAYWVAEGGDLTESAQVLAQVPLAPKTLGAFTDITRQLIIQTSIDVENWVKADLAAVMAIAIDLAALHGLGASNQPKGVTEQDDVNTVEADIAALTWADIVDLETQVALDNADLGALAYICDAATRGLLKTTEKSSGYPVYLWNDNGCACPGGGNMAMDGMSGMQGAGMVNGYLCGCTNQAQTLLFGNWNDVIIGQWTGLDMLVDPYTLGKSGGVRTIVFQDVDVAVRRGQSFSMIIPEGS